MQVLTIQALAYHRSRPTSLVVRDDEGNLYWWNKNLVMRHIKPEELEPINPEVYADVIAASFGYSVKDDEGGKLFPCVVKDYVGKVYGLGKSFAVADAYRGHGG